MDRSIWDSVKPPKPVNEMTEADRAEYRRQVHLQNEARRNSWRGRISHWIFGGLLLLAFASLMVQLFDSHHRVTNIIGNVGFVCVIIAVLQPRWQSALSWLGAGLIILALWRSFAGL